MKRYIQRQLRVALRCIVHFLLIRMLGEEIGSGVVKLARQWAKHQQVRQIEPSVEVQRGE